jgi:hypothetical protein
MLAELTPEQLTEWMAAIDYLGIDDAWNQAGTTAAAIHNAVTRALASFSKSRRIDKKHLVEATDFIPLVRPAKQKMRVQTPQQMITALGGPQRG